MDSIQPLVDTPAAFFCRFHFNLPAYFNGIPFQIRVSMDEQYRKIGMLTNDYLMLNNQFMQALTDGRPTEELTAIKEKIRQVIDEIERLEAIRSASSDKDAMTLE
jgi:hypothetical protein